jgi:segregation and condensation protein B
MELKLILEAILFGSQKPLSPRDLRSVLVSAAETDEEAGPFKKVREEELIQALESLEQEHAQAGRSFRVACVAGAWQFVTQAEYGPWLRALMGDKSRPTRLSQPALETLAIIAYRQPMTRAEIEQIRGVSVDGVMQTLVERGLVESAGRAEVVGRPMTYRTTTLFLEYFGLRNLDDLPAADELRRIVVAKPESLLTVDPGLATTPPEQLQSSQTNGVPEPETDGGLAPAQPNNAPEAQPPVQTDKPQHTT